VGYAPRLSKSVLPSIWGRSGWLDRPISVRFCETPCRLLQFKGQATLAQLVERLIRNQQVAGSIPAGGSNNSIIPNFLRGSGLPNLQVGSNCAKIPPSLS
jgi:hypothetical protein